MIIAVDSCGVKVTMPRLEGLQCVGNEGIYLHIESDMTKDCLSWERSAIRPNKNEMNADGLKKIKK